MRWLRVSGSHRCYDVTASAVFILSMYAGFIDKGDTEASAFVRDASLACNIALGSEIVHAAFVGHTYDMTSNVEL